MDPTNPINTPGPPPPPIPEKPRQASEHILQFFRFSHLPEALQQVSRPFADLAQWIAADLPRNPERTVALRKLLEAKDAAVRAVLAKEEEAPPEVR